MLHSGIQEPNGGVARYHLAAEQRNLPVSTEITGYAASTFAYLFQRTNDARYRDAAALTARFLTETAWNAELRTFPFEMAPGAPAYFFDCGIIIRGLLAVLRLTGDDRLLQVSEQAGRSMARDFLTAEAIHPIVSLPDRTPLPYQKRWSREPGCFQLKSALAWRDLAAAAADRTFPGYWRQALAMATATHETFLPGESGPAGTMDRLHAYSYFMEALLAEKSDLLAAAIPRTARYLRQIAPEFARSDVYAQLLRVRLFAHQLGVVPLDRTAAEEEASAIAAFQYQSPDRRLDGGFSFGSRGGALLPFANPVSTGFCLQALDLWEQLLHTGRIDADLCCLI
jgi:hypothetical protein